MSWSVSCQRDDWLLVFSVLLSSIHLFILFFVCLWYVFQTITGHEYPEFVKIVEVGPRDGLQNEKVYTLFHLYVFAPLFYITVYDHPGKTQFLLYLSYIKQSVTYGLCAIIARSICFAFSLKLNRKDDTVSGLVYPLSMSLLHHFLIACLSFYRLRRMHTTEIILFTITCYYEKYWMFWEIFSRERSKKRNLPDICLFTSHLEWNQNQEELFKFHCSPGNCSDRGENPADRHALRNRPVCDRGHQLCLFKVGTTGNNFSLCTEKECWVIYVALSLVCIMTEENMVF